MFASITCPACRHKYTIPEGQMGSRQNCPNCRTPFLAGKSVSEGAAAADVPMKYEPAAAPGINKTMLGETEPPIRYNCPRCKKPLESPAIEAGTKKPCPSCGQRLQVPAAPPAPPGLNKTILASTEGNPPPTGVAAGAPQAGLPMGAVIGAPRRRRPARHPPLRRSRRSWPSSAERLRGSFSCCCARACSSAFSPARRRPIASKWPQRSRNMTLR